MYQSTTQITPFLLLSNSDGAFRILLSDIIYCCSYNSSTEFFITINRRIVVSRPILYYQEILRKYGFVRIHNSTLINIAYLCHTSKGEDANELTLTTGKKLIVSRSRKNEVMSIIKEWSVDSAAEEHSAHETGKDKNDNVEKIQNTSEQ